MEYIMLVLVAFSIILSIVVAGHLCYNNKSGWGWFLFIAFILASGLKIHIP